MDEAGREIWAAARHLFGPDATAERHAFGIRVTDPMPVDGRPNRSARPVGFRISTEVADAMNQADAADRAVMARNAARAAEFRLRAYDPAGEQHDAFIIEIGPDEVDG